MAISEQTFVLLKPDCLERKLAGELISRLERRFEIKKLKYVWPTIQQAQDLYRQHDGAEFFAGLTEFTASGPCIASVWAGHEVVYWMRKIIGAANDPLPGTIRGDYRTDVRHNLIHSSETAEAAVREAKVFFS